MQYLMAIDAGTGSVRAVIFDTKGNQIAVSQKEWVHLEVEGVPNSMTFDTEKNWDLAVWCIQNVLKEAKVDGSDILAVSATSMREGIVLYNKEGELIAAIETLEDITEQKRLELELKKATQKLKQLADLDGLTKIANRRKFDKYLNFWWKQLMREQLPLSLIMSDIDYFKLFNDAYGHQAGDDCLRRRCMGDVHGV